MSVCINQRRAADDFTDTTGKEIVVGEISRKFALDKLDSEMVVNDEENCLQIGSPRKEICARTRPTTQFIKMLWR